MRKNIILSIFAFFSCTLIFIGDYYISQAKFFAYFAILLVPLIILHAIYYGAYLVAIYVWFTHVVLLKIFDTVYVKNLDLSSWRRGLMNLDDHNLTIGYIAAVEFMIFCVYFFGAFDINKRLQAMHSYKLNYKNSIKNFSFNIKAIFSLVIISFVVYVFFVFGRSRDLWLDSASGFSVLLVNLSFVFLYIATAISIDVISKDKKSGFFLLATVLFTAFMYAFSGFRYVLVAVIFILFVGVLCKNFINLKYLFFAALSSIVMYFLFILISISRNMGLSAIDVVFLYFSGDIPDGVLEEFSDAHEENIYFSLYKILAADDMYFGETYIDSVIRVLPSFVYGALFDTERVNDIINKIASESGMIDSGFNLGAFFLAEAVINFGKIGGSFVAFIVLKFLIYMEKLKFSGGRGMFYYLIIIGLIPNYVYYGLNGALKVFVYSSFILVFLQKFKIIAWK